MFEDLGGISKKKRANSAILAIFDISIICFLDIFKIRGGRYVDSNDVMARQSIIKYSLFQAMFFGNCFNIGKQQFHMYLIDGFDFVIYKMSFQVGGVFENPVKYLIWSDLWK